MMPSTRNRYSASVLLTLIVCGIEFSLSHVGPDFLIVRDTQQAIEKCEAELVVSVDGVEDRRVIRLLNDIESGLFKEVRYEPIF